MKGLFISSGLAYGIDEAAHQGASTHQRTIAVTGTGLDTTYPAQNKKLAEHILAQNGAIITEFYRVHRHYNSIFHVETELSAV